MLVTLLGLSRGDSIDLKTSRIVLFINSLEKVQFFNVSVESLYNKYYGCSCEINLYVSVKFHGDHKTVTKLMST